MFAGFIFVGLLVLLAALGVFDRKGSGYVNAHSDTPDVSDGVFICRQCPCPDGLKKVGTCGRGPTAGYCACI